MYSVKRYLGYNKGNSRNESILGKERVVFFVILLVFVLGLLLARLFVITIVEGGQYKDLAKGNRIRETKIIAPRGIIYDGSNQPLLGNIPAFFSDSGEIYFEEKPSGLDSNKLSEGVTREYIFGEATAHVLGYIGEISNDELEGKSKSGYEEYKLGDFVGKMGIEKAFDQVLRGVDGKELIEVDAEERTVRVLGRIDSIPGKRVNLALNTELQQKAFEALQEKRGVAVASNPKTGEVYLLYSSPSFDPNLFIRGSGELDDLLKDEERSLFNRAIGGAYPPGSTFKIITAVAGLETGAIDWNTQVEDTGVVQVGEYTFGNWYFNQYGKKEGMLDVVGALRRSNDIFFYKVGEEVGIEVLSEWAKKMGVGSKLGIELEGEEEGLMPDPSWRKKRRGENWYLGNTYHAAIGQGDVLATPLQVNFWTNIVANGGKLCTPSLRKLSDGQKGNCVDLGIGPETIALVKRGMKQACQPGGTGWPLFNFKVESEKLKVDNVDFLSTYESTTSGKPVVEVKTACKTGTAEFGDPQDKTHAWFTVFAPVEKPQISITVLIEEGGEGSSDAAPIAKEILERWFSS